MFTLLHRFEQTFCSVNGQSEKVQKVSSTVSFENERNSDILTGFLLLNCRKE